MSICRIQLDGPEVWDDDVDDENVDGWWIDDARITIRRDAGESIATYSLPRGSRRVVMTRLGSGRSQLALGGFTSTSVVVTGPSAAVKRLREEVL